MKENTRELVLNMLLAITEENQFSHILIRDVLNKYNYWDSKDKNFVKRLTEGTLERMIQIDYVLNGCSKVPVDKMKPLIRNLLRMSVYQILFMDGVPDSAACNEAVKLAGKRGFRNLQGYVNGVLRNIARQKDDIRWPDQKTEPVRYLSVFYSMPEWLVQKWLEELGAEATEAVLAGMLCIRPVTVRVKKDIDTEQREKWLKDLEAAGVRTEVHVFLPYAYELYNVSGVQNLPGFSEGIFMVQDVSSMLVTEAAGIKAGDFLLDVCAAPGGKALHGAERAARVQARDVSVSKTDFIRENVARMKAENVEIVEHDARIQDAAMIGMADVLFADLPCSGLGIIGKKRDIKNKTAAADLEAVVNLQREILSVVWQYVKPGGILIYSTCTINKAENQEMMEWFTGQFPFRREEFPQREQMPFAQAPGGMLQLLPGIDPTDGFFICRLRRADGVNL